MTHEKNLTLPPTQDVTINLQNYIQEGIYLAVARTFHLQSNLEVMTLHGGKYVEKQNGNSGPSEKIDVPVDL